MDDQLTWDFHVDQKARKIAKWTGILNKLKRCLPSRTLQLIYYSLIQSSLLYGLSVWGHSKFSKSNRLVILQKRAARIVAKKHFLSHTDPLFKYYNILKLPDMYTLQWIKFYISILENNYPCNYYQQLLNT